jgi:cyclic pyranopterin phosphate synthase
MISSMLKDTFNRNHHYLRISLTDVCNFRCLYCMPEDAQFMPSARLMSADEIEQIARIFVAQGVDKIRLTGGEPLVRKDAADIMRRLGKLPVELTMTTNGMLLHQYVEVMQEAGMTSVNISLDTLQAQKFLQITKRDAFYQVRQNIDLMLEKGFRVKVNCVALRGWNDDEVIDFVGLTKELPLHIRFIEFMPFKGNQWAGASVYPYEELIQQISEQFDIVKLKDELHDTTRKFKVIGHTGTFAVITTMSQPFCSGCNRLRLTADGKMKNCLFSENESDILGPFRRGEDILPIIQQNVLDKKKETGGQLLRKYEEMDSEKIVNRSMVHIGG